ncbi:Acetyltransferase (GNAT) family protein [Chitinophaga terrae (ex Kim and Jung 2007)]|jgi:GNAT superfamily N-acetyltransferase|uniref:Acetyltransferase (GNAT) family protein n=1 Tax=Chitinophaga terrae (ex Kim and Jung 2007) TaxID=408074 RepID=A0A1H4FH68_9BACT|nr:GNAT family N-acetyltransferase [Chitinophaga terrae (ex Kim and Jung 2007)]MDQ0105357.1 GNAT superfamily N-acetyltransferase [Chitinophaga terrae (ex Kim and Jung 2007)]GEP92382.1 N-acetyltransferase [Chitinophaga terrae (ex Kim and Jung 2007)]SEA95832.1 Acetyltransferase (GNAT) family protein [Chitinophaga terrae (ex Kim and Jung 2007)]
MEIINSTTADIDAIFDLLNSGTAYQHRIGAKPWAGFERELIETDVREKRAWKIVENGTMVCTFSLTFNDPDIWQEKDTPDAIYIHRISVHPDHHGKGYVKKIVEWSKAYAKSLNKTLVRMDTTGGNDKLNNYYVSCGFTLLGTVHVPKSPALPAHYTGGYSALFELAV